MAEREIRVGKRRLMISENLIDRVVRYIDPARANLRMKARALDALAGGYTGAARARRSMSQWTTGHGSADADLLPDLATLRERSRDLIRNHPIAGGAINTVTDSVVGPGLVPKANIDRDALGMSDEQAEEWEKQAEQLFVLWANGTECDITRTQNFGGLQNLAFRSAMENGDVLVLLPYLARLGSPFQLKLQLVEADRLANRSFAADTTTQAGGVTLDEHGAPTAYHIARTHPGDLYHSATEWDIVPAFGAQTGRRNVLHLYDRLRIGQHRGVPYLAPVIEHFKQLGRYTEAELMAAVVSAMFTVFIETESGSTDNLSPFAPTDESGGTTADADYKLGNGAIVGLAKGEKVSTASPGRPFGGFDQFVMSILRQIGVALGIPYEILIKHFTSSYTAARAAMTEAWRFYLGRREWLVQNFCQPVWEAFLDEQVAEGRLAAPGYFADPMIRAAYVKAIWFGRPQGQIDPTKEIEAAAKRVEVGVSTLEYETQTLMGMDWLSVHKQQVKEHELRQAAGLGPVPKAEKAAPPPPGSSDDKPDPEDDDDDEEVEK